MGVQPMRESRYHHSSASPHERSDKALELEYLQRKLVELATNPKPPAHRTSYELYVQALKFFADEDAQSRDTSSADDDVQFQNLSSTDDGFCTSTHNDSTLTAISQPLCEQTLPPPPRNKSKRKLDRLEEDDRKRMHEQPRALRSSKISEFWQLDGDGIAEEAKKRPRFC